MVRTCIFCLDLKQCSCCVGQLVLETGQQDVQTALVSYEFSAVQAANLGAKKSRMVLPKALHCTSNCLTIDKLWNTRSTMHKVHSMYYFVKSWFASLASCEFIVLLGGTMITTGTNTKTTNQPTNQPNKPTNQQKRRTCLQKICQPILIKHLSHSN